MDAHVSAAVLSPCHAMFALRDGRFELLSMIIINPIGRNSRRFCALPPRFPVVEMNCESFPQLKNTRDHINSEVSSGDQTERVAASSLASDRKI